MKIWNLTNKDGYDIVHIWGNRDLYNVTESGGVLTYTSEALGRTYVIDGNELLMFKEYDVNSKRSYAFETEFAPFNIPENRIDKLSNLTYDISRSYNGSSYPTVRYGGSHFQVSGDGQYLIYTYTDYNYHQQRRLTLNTPWDFSSMSGYISSGNIDLSNHYQNDMYITEDGTKLFVGGYSNSNVAGWDDIYKQTLTTPWNPTSGSWTTYGNNFRTNDGMPVSTAYGILGFDSNGTRMLVRNNIDTDNSTVLVGTHLVRQYELSVPYSQNWTDSSSLSGALNAFDYITGLSPLIDGNGWFLLPITMNKAGTQMLVSAIEYTGGSVTSYRIYKIDLSEGWNLNSTISCDTSDFIDVLARHQSGSIGIQGIKYGQSDKEIVLQIGNGTYGQTNGVYSYWQVLR